MQVALLFAGEEYYPGGGSSDLVGTLPSVDEQSIIDALAARPFKADWADVIVVEDGQVTGKYRWVVTHKGKRTKLDLILKSGNHFQK